MPKATSNKISKRASRMAAGHLADLIGGNDAGMLAGKLLEAADQIKLSGTINRPRVTITWTLDDEDNGEPDNDNEGPELPKEGETVAGAKH